MTTPYALQLVVSEYLKTGESFRSVARDVGVSRQAVARIARYGPDEVLRRPRVNVEVPSPSSLSPLALESGVNAESEAAFRTVKPKTVPW